MGKNTLKFKGGFDAISNNDDIKNRILRNHPQRPGETHDNWIRRFSQEQQRQRIAPYLQLNAAPVARRVQFDRAMPVINEENNAMELNRPDEYEAVQQAPRPGGSRRNPRRKSRRKSRRKTRRKPRRKPRRKTHRKKA